MYTCVHIHVNFMCVCSVMAHTKQCIKFNYINNKQLECLIQDPRGPVIFTVYDSLIISYNVTVLF